MAKKNPRLKRQGTQEEYTRSDMMEVAKCVNDPIYFIEKYVKIKHPIKGQIPFILRDYQKEIIRGFMENRWNIVLSARQTGKSETISAYILWFCLFNEEKTVLIVSNKASNAKEILGKIKYAYEELPNFIKPGVDDSEWNKHEIAFDNKCRIKAVATTEDSARGLSVSLLFCDELAFVPPNIQLEFWNSVQPTLSTGGSCIIASTPNGDSNLFASLYRSAENGNNVFKHYYVPWNAAPGRDEAFKEEQISIIGLRQWEQEYECSFLTTQNGLFDGKILNNIELEIGDGEPLFNVDEFMFFAKIREGSTYMVGVDPATGNGDDSSVINIFSFPELEQVGVYRNNTTRPHIVYSKLKFIVNFLKSKKCTVYWSVERNAVGESIISLYEVDEVTPEGHLISGEQKNSLGFYTTAPTKIKFSLKLRELVETGMLKIRHKHTLIEAKSFVRRNGSFAGLLGSNDDCIMSILIVLQIINEIAMADNDAYNLMYKFSAQKFEIDNSVNQFVINDDDTDTSSDIMPFLF